MPSDKEYNAFKNQTGQDLVRIQETLIWHAKIGWGAIALAGATVVGLVTWYLPNNVPSKTDFGALSGKVQTLTDKEGSIAI
jgi:hypothetical protein